MARFLSVSPGSVAVAASMGNNSMPQCTFGVHRAGEERVHATANVDSSPQPYFRLERTTVEATQVLLPARMPGIPQVVNGLGLEATWFPAHTQLMSTDGVRLITVSVSWTHARERRERALAEALSRTYLRTPHGRRAQALARGAPSPF